MKIERDALIGKLTEMKSGGYAYLVKITAVDYGKTLQALYFVRDLDRNLDETVMVELQEDDAWVPTVIGIFRAADWYERELYEMFGIRIHGRRIRRLLLEKWDGTEFPLRKSFAWNSDYKKE